METIRIADGVAHNVELHAERMNRSRRIIFDCREEIDPAQLLVTPPSCAKGIVKCRVVYDRAVRAVEFAAYARRSIDTLRLVDGGDLDYEFKYEDRSVLSRLFERRDGCGDILIVKRGLVTDTSFSNVAFFDGRQWVTPAKPLLRGVRRERLIRDGLLVEADIAPGDLRRFERVSLINAMLDLEECTVDVRNILLHT